MTTVLFSFLPLQMKADLLSSEETKERHQQPPDSTKQAETHVEELFGPLKQLFDEALKQHPSPLAQQQDKTAAFGHTNNLHLL